MAGLSEFDIGTSESGAQDLLNDLDINVIQGLKEDLVTGLDPVFAALDDAWVGNDCDTYKKNIKATIDKLCDELDTLKVTFASELEKINNDMSEFQRSQVIDDTTY